MFVERRPPRYPSPGSGPDGSAGRTRTGPTGARSGIDRPGAGRSATGRTTARLPVTRGCGDGGRCVPVAGRIEVRTAVRLEEQTVRPVRERALHGLRSDQRLGLGVEVVPLEPESAIGSRVIAGVGGVVTGVPDGQPAMHEPLQVVGQTEPGALFGVHTTVDQHPAPFIEELPSPRLSQTAGSWPPSGLRTNGQSMDLAQQSPPLAPYQVPPNPVLIGRSRDRTVYTGVRTSRTSSSPPSTNTCEAASDEVPG